MFATQQLNNLQSQQTAIITKAIARYHKLRQQANLAAFWARLTHRATELCTLPARRAGEQHYAGNQVVPISQIKGSEGRTADFDQAFRPLRETTLERWVSIFKARTQGQDLPPVELVRMGDTFYVRDGHHRISVARALGQRYIDATVTVWR
jgi:hypothetical protein